MVARHRHEDYWLYAGTQTLTCRHRITPWLFSAVCQQDIVWSHKLLIQEYSGDREVSQYSHYGNFFRMTELFVWTICPFMVFHHEIKWAKRLTQLHYYLRLICLAPLQRGRILKGLALVRLLPNRKAMAETYRRCLAFSKCFYRAVAKASWASHSAPSAPPRTKATKRYIYNKDRFFTFW